MSAQLSLIDASHVVESREHPPIYGDDLTSDIEAVVSRIPSFGASKNTARAHVRRVTAYLYARVDMLDADSRRVVERITASCTGRTLPPWTDPHFARLNGERTDGRGYGDSRNPALAVSPRHGAAVWMLEFRKSGNEHATAAIESMVMGLRPGIRACVSASWPEPNTLRVLLPALAPLVLALRWSDHVAAAVFLAGSGVEPKSGEWAQLVDQALARGLPWSIKLAELSARHPRDVLSRALAWVHANRGAT
jgi:hypothetical protein